MRLYYHKTDGGAEYLCSESVEGTDEGSFNSKYIVRIDGDIEKDAELNIKEGEFKYCPRCIEDWEENDVKYIGSKVSSDCFTCGVCYECEHMQECKYNK